MRNLNYPDYLNKLSRSQRRKHQNISLILKEALKVRMAFFDSMGCRASDHALEYVMYKPATDAELEAIFAKRLEWQ